MPAVVLNGVQPSALDKFLADYTGQQPDQVPQGQLLRAIEVAVQEHTFAAGRILAALERAQTATARADAINALMALGRSLLITNTVNQPVARRDP